MSRRRFRTWGRRRLDDYATIVPDLNSYHRPPCRLFDDADRSGDVSARKG